VGLGSQKHTTSVGCCGATPWISVAALINTQRQLGEGVRGRTPPARIGKLAPPSRDKTRPEMCGACVMHPTEVGC
jgi:hypothetical protein